MSGAIYPASASQRTRWVDARRAESAPKSRLDPWTAYAAIEETEPGSNGEAIPTATLFLTNRECPYRCLMCDLWRNTLDERVPPGAIPAQIRKALGLMPGFAGAPPEVLSRSQIKLYNAGSFFDPNAIPPEDYSAIAAECAGFGRVVVESHPALIGRRTVAFQRLIDARLEVAIGLETVHPDVMERLNKRVTLDGLRRAAEFLRAHGTDLRVFILLRPPFLTEAEGLEWAVRSLDFAFEIGASVCCVIPTRGGNGAMEALAAQGQYAPPTLRSLERSVEYGLSQGGARIFADLWDIERFAECECASARIARLGAMNRWQTVPPPVVCARCVRDGEVR